MTVELKVQGGKAFTEEEKLVPRWLPGLLAALLFLVNNLGVIHGMISPPPGYVPMGVQRNSDIAQYLTWIRALEKAWILPNYHAPWLTSRGLVVPGLIPAALLARLFSLTPVVALQIFTLAGYILTAYALVFAYETFCRSRRQALWSLLLAVGCVPMAALPGVFRLVHNPGLVGTSGGLIEYMTVSEGFLHGLLTWPLLTYGTCGQVLSIALLARYCNTRDRRWLGWLAGVCLLSALVHPFEICVTVVVVAVVFLQEEAPLARNLVDLGVVLTATAIGFAPHALGALLAHWLRPIENANRHAVPTILPAWLLAMLGLPSILAVMLLLLGLPKRPDRDVTILRAWFVCTLLVFYVPGVPFALHLLDGVFFAAGFLLTIQIEDLSLRYPFLTRPVFQALAALAVVWMIFPNVTFRLKSWRDGVSVRSIEIPAGLAPVDEPAAIGWLRKNASPNDLVLATQDAAPWIATTPIHSFASHWLFSSQQERPGDEILRTSFFNGTLPPAKAHDFLEALGVRFVVVPDASQAKLYLSEAVPRVHLTDTTVYEIPGAKMKPNGDSRIVQLGVSP